MTSERECFVYIVPPGQTRFVTAGRFRVSTNPDGIDVGEFVYRKQYRERSDAVELDPMELTLREGRFETTRMRGFFGAIRDSMPDAWGRRVIERNAGLAVLDEFEYLLKGPDDRAGALGFGLNVTPPAPERKFNRTLHLDLLQRAADAVARKDSEATGSAEAQLEELLQLRTSIGGARPKAVVEDDDRLWIAKFEHPDDEWNHPRVEHAMLRLARACGLNAAESKLVTAGNRDVLLVHRFDRDRADDGYRRHRMVSALTVLRGDDDLVDRPRWSYLRLADELRRTSGSPETDLRELFARMCFNAAVSNTDDHLRNHAILAKDRNWQLSPAYDLTPMPLLSVERRDLALVCGEYGRYANRKNLLSGHGHFLLDAQEASEILEAIVGTVRTQWRPALRRAGVEEEDCESVASAFLYPGFFY